MVLSRRVFLLIALGMLFLTVTALGRIGYEHHTITRIRVGMSEQDVVRLLGQPDHVVTGRSEIAFWWGNQGLLEMPGVTVYLYYPRCGLPLRVNCDSSGSAVVILRRAGRIEVLR